MSRSLGEGTRLTIGAKARCSDGPCGKVTRVVVDPIVQTVTHLVVEPERRVGLGRLVPLALLDPTTSEVRLRCAQAQFDELDAAEESHFLPSSNTYADYAQEQVLLWPNYGLEGDDGAGTGGSAAGAGPGLQAVISDTLPAGEVAIRRGDQVHAVDGHIGHVQGLVVDQPGHHITHVLLQEGHLFGRKEVAIPATAIVEIRGGLVLNLTRQQVQDLPAVHVRQPTAPDPTHG